MPIRSIRLEKKLHKIWLVNVAEDIVMDRDIEKSLWDMNQGDSMEFTRSKYKNSEVLNYYNLNIIMERGPIKGHWLHKQFDQKELNLFFYAKQFPNIAHGWTLFDEDKNI